VELFIVISGFSLMLPVIRSREQQLKGGTLRFFNRRARRILPPYYVALAVSLVLIAVVPGMNRPSGMLNYSDLLLPAFEPNALISHLLLVHNISPNLELRINPPMWSIAVEWQIYFLFPLLVYVWRRWGVGALLAAGLVFGVGQAIAQPWTGWLTYPLGTVWYLFLFVEGMLGAIIAFSQQPALQRLRQRLPWHWIALVAFVALVGVKAAGKLAGDLPDWSTDPLIGLASMAMLIHLSGQMHRPSGQASRLLRIVSTPWLVRIGHFSYSLYLIHAPILVAFSLIWLALGTPILLAYGLNILVGGPLCVAIAYLFFLFFERPFISSEARKHSNQVSAKSHNGLLNLIRNRVTPGLPVQE
ncbi:MAG TPA: acyltransferase, partial [Roseiflexaceae bacterium]|nr:acyltransferase [Roseiflexaceae bacterium]